MEVPVRMWEPDEEKIAAVVAWRESGVLGRGGSVRGVVGMRCLIGMGEVMSTRRGRSSKRETTKRYGLEGCNSAV